MKPPKELEKSYLEAFEAIWNFSHKCKEHEVCLEKCLAMIISCFFSLFGDKPTPEWRRDIIVTASNDCLDAVERCSR